MVIGFPANNFLGQEPGSDAEIQSFCTLTYQVGFPMMSKISVKGSDAAPLYLWLQKKELNGVANAKVGWNFHKFLISEHGIWAKSFGSSTSPLDKEIIKWIED